MSNNITFSERHQGCGTKEAIDKNVEIKDFSKSLDSIKDDLMASYIDLEDLYQISPSKEIYDRIVLLDRVINL